MSRPFVPILRVPRWVSTVMARAFWEAYGVKSYAYGTFP
jgi:hypothetical protein